MRIKGEVKLRTLIILVVILSTIFYGMVLVAKSNILVQNNISETINVGSVEELEAACGFNIELPEKLRVGSTYEFDSVSIRVHIWNDRGEMVAISKPSEEYDILEYLEIEEFSTISDIGEYTDIKVRHSYGYNNEELTLVSYNSDEVSYGVIIIGNISNEEIEELLLSTE